MGGRSSPRAACYFRRPTACASDSLRDCSSGGPMPKDEAFTRRGLHPFSFQRGDTLFHTPAQTSGTPGDMKQVNHER